MGIKDIFAKTMKRVKKSTGSDLELDELEDIGGPEGELSEFEAPGENLAEVEMPEATTADKELTETPKKPVEEVPEAEVVETAPIVEPKAPTQREDTSVINAEFDKIKQKLDLLTAHIEKIETQEDLQKTEADRVIQYLTLINEKLDTIEREHNEIERLIQKK